MRFALAIASVGHVWLAALHTIDGNTVGAEVALLIGLVAGGVSLALAFERPGGFWSEAYPA